MKSRVVIARCAALCALLFACGDDDGMADAGGDASADGTVDVVPDTIPDGPRGEVLRVPEDERWTLPTLQEPVYVLHTEADVPHIYAANDRDLRVAQGFVMARDRYFQIEAGRRLVQGRLGELLGDTGLAADQLAAGQGMRRIAARLSSLLTAEQRELMEAFTEGVNAYVRAVKDRLLPGPSELVIAAPALGLSRAGDAMVELTADEVLAFAVVPIFQLGFETRDLVEGDVRDRLVDIFTDGEREAALRRAGVVRDIVSNVSPINPLSSTPGFGLEDGRAFLPDFTPRRPTVSVARPTPLRVERRTYDRLLDRTERFRNLALGGRGEDFGSNAWATAGDRGEGGAAVFASDGHLPLDIAPFFYQLGLDTSVFGEGEEADTELLGLFFAGVPIMGVGTNGRIAWSQTYLRGDVTDWYAEELLLDASGAPRASVFRGGERDLIQIDESYDIGSALGSVPRTEVWARWETFDGRIISAIEGRPATADTTPGAGETLVNVQGDYVIPDDVDGDGAVSAVSFDYTAFDVSNLLRALQGWNEADDVAEFREVSREMVTYAQNMIAADVDGGIYNSGYNATPSRSYLPRDAEGVWLEGADPQAVLDGTQHAGFEIVLDENGIPDESACDSDPQTCLVPFDRYPARISPSEGFVFTANNDIANITTDGDFFDDEFHVGGPWNNGFRARTIAGRLAEVVDARNSTVQRMRDLQDDHRSVLGLDFGETLLESIDEAQRVVDGPSGADETRLADLYRPERDAIDEVETRLREWIARGAAAASGVETFYDSPTADDRRDAVATMIFNEWWKRTYRRIFGDEGIDFAFGPDRPTAQTRAMNDLLFGRGPGNPRGLASWDPATEESVFFDSLDTEAVVEHSHEILLAGLIDALEVLRAEGDPEAPGTGGFGTADMDQWLWGLRHLVVFDSVIKTFVSDAPAFAFLASGFSISPSRLPLADDLPDGDPRADLPWFPRPGDNFNVDAAHASLDRDDYWYKNGPVMRMVIRLERDNITGVNVLPGGQSGRKESEHFDDQARLWLGNETVPMRFHVADVVEGATRRETLTP